MEISICFVFLYCIGFPLFLYCIVFVSLCGCLLLLWQIVRLHSERKGKLKEKIFFVALAFPYLSTALSFFSACARDCSLHICNWKISTSLSPTPPFLCSPLSFDAFIVFINMYHVVFLALGIAKYFV